MFIRNSFLPNIHEIRLIRDEAALGRLFETHADPEGKIRLAPDEIRGKGPALAYGVQYGQLSYVGEEQGQLVYQRTATADPKFKQEVAPA
ncbi:MAG: hypothetical protein AB7E85_01815 [Pseudobdellovibrionaceae bacterium]